MIPAESEPRLAASDRETAYAERSSKVRPGRFALDDGSVASYHAVSCHKGVVS